MGNLKDSLICGYFDECQNYIVEINQNKLQQIIEEDDSLEELKGFTTNIEKKIKVYDALKEELTPDLDVPYTEFIVEMKE